MSRGSRDEDVLLLAEALITLGARRHGAPWEELSKDATRQVPARRIMAAARASAVGRLRLLPLAARRGRMRFGISLVENPRSIIYP